MKSLDFYHYVTPIKPRSHMPSGAFFICETFPSLLYLLAFFPDKIVTASLFIALEHVQGFAEVSCRRKCHRSMREKGTATKAKSLFVGSLEISTKKSSH